MGVGAGLSVGHEWPGAIAGGGWRIRSGVQERYLETLKLRRNSLNLWWRFVGTVVGFSKPWHSALPLSEGWLLQI